MADDDRRDERRPDPDALLALAEKDRRGKLTVFLGAAPGVGKTYEMLRAARTATGEPCAIAVQAPVEIDRLDQHQYLEAI